LRKDARGNDTAGGVVFVVCCLLCIPQSEDQAEWSTFEVGLSMHHAIVSSTFYVIQKGKKLAAPTSYFLVNVIFKELLKHIWFNDWRLMVL